MILFPPKGRGLALIDTRLSRVEYNAISNTYIGIYYNIIWVQTPLPEPKIKKNNHYIIYSG